MSCVYLGWRDVVSGRSRSTKKWQSETGNYKERERREGRYVMQIDLQVVNFIIIIINFLTYIHAFHTLER